MVVAVGVLVIAVGVIPMAVEAMVRNVGFIIIAKKPWRKLLES